MMETSITWLIKMSFPARLIALRKQKGLSQQAMAEAIGLHGTQIKRYESGSSQPSLEAINKIAVALSVSTDSLLFEENECGPDDDLRLQFDAVSRMPKKERLVIREVIDGMILKYETQRWHQQRASSG